MLRILRNEWRNLAADRTLAVVALLFTALIAYGLFNGTAWVRFQRTALDQIATEHRQRMAGLKQVLTRIEGGQMPAPTGFRDPRTASFIGNREGVPYTVMPPVPLAALSIGQSDLYPYYFRAGTGSRYTLMAGDELENPTNLVTGRFDLAFVLVYLYPLLILALSYNLLSAEKEQGTLALTLSQPVSLTRLLAGKILARAAILFGLVLLVSAAALLLTGATLGDPAVLGLFLLWTLVVAVYGAFWFALAVLGNAFNGSSAANALGLAGVWLVLVVLLPAAVNGIATSLYPVPSRVEMIQAMRTATQQVSSQGSQILARYLEDHPELAAPESGRPAAPDFASLSLAVQSEVDQRIQPVLAHFDQQVAGQRRLVDRFRFLSPAILAQSAMNDVAGSSLERYEHFRAQTAAFLDRWLAWFRPRTFQQAVIRAEELDALPVYRYQHEPGGQVRARVLVALAGISVPALLASLWALSRLRRYPIAG